MDKRTIVRRRVFQRFVSKHTGMELMRAGLSGIFTPTEVVVVVVVGGRGQSDFI